MDDHDSTVIEAIRRAVEAHPEDNDLRAHLAELLSEAGLSSEGLEQCSLVLGRDPAHRRALEIGVAAATAVGEEDRAASYRRLLDLLDGTSDAGDTAVGRVREVPAEGPELDNEFAVDAFLEEVLGDVSAPGAEVVTLDDVGGLVEVKRRLRTSFLGPIGNPELRELYGTSLRGGLLMYGPPGCGKTFLARALAGELGARFYGIGIHDVLDMWMGNSERNLHAVFDHARQTAPSVLFLDEVDALGRKRSQLAYSSARNVVVQLLSELDGIGEVNDGVFVLAATNQPWDVDSALRRPGRLDRTMLVLPPDVDARRAILELHLRNRPVDGVDVARVAAATEGYSGADLRLVCDSAAENALAESIDAGTARPITQDDLEHALRDTRPSTSEWFQTANNYARFANDDGAYDDLLAYIRANRLG